MLRSNLMPLQTLWAREGIGRRQTGGGNVSSVGGPKNLSKAGEGSYGMFSPPRVFQPPFAVFWKGAQRIPAYLVGIFGEIQWRPFHRNRERPKRDDDNWEPHLVDHQMLHLRPPFHFTIQKRDNTKGIQILHQMLFWVVVVFVVVVALPLVLKETMPRKIGKFGAKFKAKIGTTKIRKIRGTFVLYLFWPNN